MPGPAPKPNALRPNQGGTYIKLPSEGRKEDPPEWPSEEGMPEDAVMARWRYLWKLPQAVMWEKLNMIRTVARYCYVLTVAEQGYNTHVYADALRFEDRLGLNPMSMMRLRWTVVDDELAEKRTEVTPPSAKVRIKAVERKAS